MDKLLLIVSICQLFVGLVMSTCGLIDKFDYQPSFPFIQNIAVPLWTGCSVIFSGLLGVFLCGIENFQQRTSVVKLFKALCILNSALSFFILIVYGITLGNMAQQKDNNTRFHVTTVIVATSVLEVFFSSAAALADERVSDAPRSN